MTEASTSDTDQRLLVGVGAASVLKGLPQPGVALVTDPGARSFAEAGLDRSFARAFASGDARRAFRRARSGGFAITGWMGDVLQLGGLLVVRPPATPAFVFRARFAGDLPPFPEVVAAVLNSAAPGIAGST